VASRTGNVHSILISISLVDVFSHPMMQDVHRSLASTGANLVPTRYRAEIFIVCKDDAPQDANGAPT
jgi:hypothetical protein